MAKLLAITDKILVNLEAIEAIWVSDERPDEYLLRTRTAYTFKLQQEELTEQGRVLLAGIYREEAI